VPHLPQPRAATAGFDPPPAPPPRPARYSDLLHIREYRALFVADSLSVVGDQVTKIAIAALVFQRTGSALLTALAFAIAYLPWLAGGPVLAALADRLPRRRVMVACDLARAGTVALLVVPGLPLPALYALLFAASLLAPPFSAARAATLPDVLPGDLYVAGSALSNISFQAGQVLGLLAGGAFVATLTVQGALALDVLTFLLSAVILRRGLADRPVVAREIEPPTLLADTAEGLRLVAGSPVLRSLVLLAWVGAAFNVVPEGLAVVEADREGGGPLAYGALIAAVPAGVVTGSLLYARLLAPVNRLRMMLPVCLVGFVPLIASPWSPSVLCTGVLWFLAGASACYQLAANAAFVSAVPPVARGRAFGVAQSGLVATQGLALVTAGALAEFWAPRTVVAVAGVCGLVGIGWLARSWPHAELRALAQTRR
jgi:MFS family permease